MNKILTMFSRLLADATTDNGWIEDIKTTVGNIIDAVLWPAIAIILTIGIVYVIILGVNYAKAETSDKKEEAKKRIINAVVGVVIMLALIIILKVVVANLTEIEAWVNGFSTQT